MNEETRKIYGKPKRNGSQWKEVFAAAINEMDLNPDLPVDLFGVGATRAQADQQTPHGTPAFSFEPAPASILKRVPKGSRNQACSALTQTIRAVLNDNDDSAWCRLLEFSSRCFGKPRRGGKKSGLPEKSTVRSETLQIDHSMLKRLSREPERQSTLQKQLESSFN